jgi:hypothetical protein
MSWVLQIGWKKDVNPPDATSSLTFVFAVVWSLVVCHPENEMDDVICGSCSVQANYM